MVTHCLGEVNNMTSQVITASGGGTGSPAASPLPTQIDTASITSSPTNISQPQQRRTNENRRSNKPIMEKRRRARINNCLNELKSLILDAMKKDPARHSKLEKADILEMTVKHLENMQRQQIAMTAATDPQIINKFRAGFSECAGEVGRFPGLEPPVRRRLLQHLANVLNSSTGTEGNNNVANNNTNNNNLQNNGQNNGAPTVQSAGVQVHILPASDTPQSGILFSTTTSGGGLQLVPTRLPNGDIALVLPSTNNTRQISTPSPNSNSNNSVSTSPVPMLIPIPSRTSSTTSCSNDLSPNSSTSATTISTSTSPISFDRLTVSTTPSPQPLQQQISPTTTINQHHHHPHYQQQTTQYQNHSPVNISPTIIRTTKPKLESQTVSDYNIQQQKHLNHYSSTAVIDNNQPQQLLTTATKHQTIIHHQQQQQQQQQSRSINNYNNIQNTTTPTVVDNMKPLSLVMKKEYHEMNEDGKPWRPW